MDQKAAIGTASAEPPKAQDKDEVMDDIGGVIFATDSSEQLEYFIHNRVGRASEEHFQYIRYVRKGMPVFFLRRGELFGVFEASSDGDLVSQPEGKHYAQVQVRIQDQSQPLSADMFLPVLGPGATLEKMKLHLTQQQAKSLRLSFTSSSRTHHRRSAPPSNGSRAPPQKSRVPDPNWGYDRTPHYRYDVQPNPQPRPQPQPQPHHSHSHRRDAPGPYAPPPHEDRRHPDGPYGPPPWRDTGSRGYPPPHHSHYGPPVEDREYGPRSMRSQPSYGYSYYSHGEYRGPGGDYRGAAGDYHERWGDHPPPYAPPPHYQQPIHDSRRGPSHMDDYEHPREAMDRSRSPVMEPVEKQQPPAAPLPPQVDEEKRRLQEESQALKKRVGDLERELAEEKLRSERSLGMCRNEQTRLAKLLEEKEAAYEKSRQEIQAVRAQMFSSYDINNEIQFPQGAPPRLGTPPGIYSRPVSPEASQGSYTAPLAHTGTVPPPATTNGVTDHSHYHQHQYQYQHQAVQSPRSDHCSQAVNIQHHPASPRSANPPSQQSHSLPRPSLRDEGELPTPDYPVQQGVQSSYSPVQQGVQSGYSVDTLNPHQGTVTRNVSLPTPMDDGAPAQHHQRSNAGFQTSVANFHQSQNEASFSNMHASPRPSPNGSGLVNGNPNGGNFSEGGGMGSGMSRAGPPQSHQSESQAGYSQQYPTPSEMEHVHTARPTAASPRYSAAPVRNFGPFDDKPVGLSR